MVNSKEVSNAPALSAAANYISSLISVPPALMEFAKWQITEGSRGKGCALRRFGARAGERLAVAYNDKVSGYDRNVETMRELLVENQRLQVREEAKAESG